MDLPTGTVTFLFTDIEASIRLREYQPEAVRVALARHNTLIIDAIMAAGSHVSTTVGDASCTSFDTGKGEARWRAGRPG